MRSNQQKKTKFEIQEVYAEQEVPFVPRHEMKPARNTVYGVPFLDQQALRDRAQKAHPALKNSHDAEAVKRVAPNQRPQQFINI